MIELLLGHDVKLYGRVSRYRVAHLGPYDDPDYYLADDEMVVQRNSPTYPGRKIGPQIVVRRDEIEAFCTGMTDHGWPVWSPITTWRILPKMPGHLYCEIDHEAFTTSGDSIFGFGQQAAIGRRGEIVYVTLVSGIELALMDAEA